MDSNTDAQEQSSRHWPLHKIAEVHASNDVVWDDYYYPKEESNPAFCSTDFQQHEGNLRFQELLLQYKDDYAARPRLEKPLVALHILKAWRNQSPPGRFLVVESPSSSHPLYKDVGDKKARSKISKALKRLLKKANSNLGKQNSKEETEIAATESTKSISTGSVSPIGLITPKTNDEEKSPAPNIPLQASNTGVIRRRVSQALNIPQPATGVRRSVSQALQQPQQKKKLYGRQEEFQQLASILDDQRRRKQNSLDADGVVDFILFKGSTGVGKTVLAHQAVESLWRNSLPHPEDESDQQQPAEPFFLKAVFEQYKWSLPNAVFVDLITDFCEQLEQRNDPSLQKRYQEHIQSLLKEDGSLLMDLVPAFRKFLLTKPKQFDKRGSSEETERTATTTSTAATSSDAYESLAAQRVQRVLLLFFQGIAEASPSHPIIVLFEDLTFASEAAVNIVAGLIAGSEHNLLFLATLKTDHPCKPYLTKRLGHLQSSSANVNLHEILVDNLSPESVHEMLADALHLMEHETQSLRDLVVALTKGNPAFITQVLRMLQEKGALYYDENSRQWTCDLADVGIDLESIQSVLDLWKSNVLDLPPKAQETLKYASCLMTPILNVSILEMIDPGQPISTHLQSAQEKGLLRQNHESGEWGFANDGVRRAVYDMISEEQKPAYHLKIGQRMWGNCSPDDCVLLMQLWLGLPLVKQDEDLRTMAALFLKTGQKAAKHVGFQTSWYALSGAIRMVGSLKDTWGRDSYDLSLQIYNTAIEICYINGEFSEELERLIEEVMENARTFEDSLTARSTLVKKLGTDNKKMEAIDLALETLGKLGERFPKRPSALHAMAGFRRVRSLLNGKSDEDILQLPRMRNPQKVAAQQMLAHAYYHTMFSSHHLAALMAFRMLELTIKFGLSAMSAMGFGVYSITLCRFGHSESYRYGRLGLKVCDVFKRDVWFSRAAAAFYGVAYCRRKPVKETREPLINARRAALRAGDLEFAMLNGAVELWNIGELLSVPDLERHCRVLAAEAGYHGQLLSVMMIRPLWQFASNMMGRAAGDPKILQGELLGNALAEDTSQAGYTKLRMYVHFFSMKLAFLFGDLDLAETFRRRSAEIYAQHHGHMTGVFSLTYECLVLLGHARAGKRRFCNLRKVRRRLKKLKGWTGGCPENFLDKQCLIEAELSWACGKHSEAHNLFRLAIVQSRDQGFWMEEAVANEQLGKLYMHQKDTDAAIPYLRAAQRVYEKWGANAKAQHMEEEWGDVWQC